MCEMSVGDCFSFIQNGANIKQGEVDGGYPITRIETISNNRFSRDRMGYAGITDITPYRAYVLEDGDILMSHINSVRYLGRAVKYSKHDDETIIHGMNLLRLKAIRGIVIPDYACLYFSSRHFREQISRITKKSVNQASFSVADLKRAKMLIASLEEQKQIVALMSRIDGIVQTRKAELKALDQLIKARFVEMFGDFKTNPKGWPTVGFEEIATIDGNMTTDYERYADYPHIGIDSIEKDTGILRGYRTVAEDGVISGKYVFTPEHIIYSKIRPNLNKVALPDFEGLCSADAYPILPIPGKCNLVFLAYDMRSTFFLDYILQFCNRTNLPKVNRKEVSGFRTPLPPLALQNEFAAFVSQVDKSKLTIQASLDQLEILKQSLMQKYFE